MFDFIVNLVHIDFFSCFCKAFDLAYLIDSGFGIPDTNPVTSSEPNASNLHNPN